MPGTLKKQHHGNSKFLLGQKGENATHKVSQTDKPSTPTTAISRRERMRNVKSIERLDMDSNLKSNTLLSRSAISHKQSSKDLILNGSSLSPLDIKKQKYNTAKKTFDKMNFTLRNVNALRDAKH